MSISQKILLIILSSLILGVLLLIYSSPPAVDWSPSYEQNDTRPLGSKVFYDLVRKEAGEWKNVYSPPFELIEDIPQSATYVFINQYFTPDRDELGLLLNWVQQGGHLFVSASGLSAVFLDSLGLTQHVFPNDFEDKRSYTLSLESPMTLSHPITYDGWHMGEYFQWEDSVQIRTLGRVQVGDSPDTGQAQPNFIQLRRGRGQVTLHAFPEVFSNYFLLNKTDSQYTEQLLGTWDLNHPVWLDHYFKLGKTTHSSPLYLILADPNLKAAYLTCWVLLVLWVLFEGKRRQKAIRVITPPQNQSLEFAKTIATIYLDQKDMTELGRLQLKLFWDYCRSKFNLQPDENKDLIAITLASKSGVRVDDTQALVSQLAILERKTPLDAEDIQSIYELIEAFKIQQQHGRNPQYAG